MATKNDLQRLHRKLVNLIELFRTEIDEVLLHDGDKEEDSQRICVLNKLNELEHVTNGIELSDLK